MSSSKAPLATPRDFAVAFGHSKEGQAVYAELCRLFANPPFQPGHPDVTAFNCGTKAVVEHIFGEICKVEPPPQLPPRG